jgi:hypothetical protein
MHGVSLEGRVEGDSGRSDINSNRVQGSTIVEMVNHMIDKFNGGSSQDHQMVMGPQARGENMFNTCTGISSNDSLTPIMSSMNGKAESCGFKVKERGVERESTTRRMIVFDSCSVMNETTGLGTSMTGIGYAYMGLEGLSREMGAVMKFNGEALDYCEWKSAFLAGMRAMKLWNALWFATGPTVDKDRKMDRSKPVDGLLDYYGEKVDYATEKSQAYIALMVSQGDNKEGINIVSRAAGDPVEAMMGLEGYYNSQSTWMRSKYRDTYRRAEFNPEGETIIEFLNRMVKLSNRVNDGLRIKGIPYNKIDEAHREYISHRDLILDILDRLAGVELYKIKVEVLRREVASAKTSKDIVSITELTDRFKEGMEEEGVGYYAGTKIKDTRSSYGKAPGRFNRNGKAGDGGSGSGKPTPGTGKCHICGKEGHWKRECPSYKGKSRPGGGGGKYGNNGKGKPPRGGDGRQKGSRYNNKGTSTTISIDKKELEELKAYKARMEGYEKAKQEYGLIGWIDEGTENKVFSKRKEERENWGDMMEEEENELKRLNNLAADADALLQLMKGGKYSTDGEIRGLEDSGDEEVLELSRESTEGTTVYSYIGTEELGGVSPTFPTAYLSTDQRSGNWIVDSGASKHMTGKQEWLMNKKEVKYNIKGIGERGIKVTHEGDIIGEIRDANGSIQPIMIRNVLYSKDLTINLFSTRNAVLNGGEVLHSGKGSYIRIGGISIPLIGQGDGLWFFHLFNADVDAERMLNRGKVGIGMHAAIGSPSTLLEMPGVGPDSLRNNHENILRAPSQPTRITMNINEFHTRFSHRHKKDLELIAEKLGVRLTGHLTSCFTCALGKVRVPPLHRTTTVYESKVFERIHLDLRGPIMVGRGTYQNSYALMIVDGYSRRVWEYRIPSKDRTYKIFYNWYQQEILNKPGRKIEYLRSDNGTEFRNHNFNQFCSRNGIIREFTAPYTPQHNAKVERAIVLIFRSCIMSLEHSKMRRMPYLFEKVWPYALGLATYVHNYAPNRMNGNMVPMEGFPDEMKDQKVVRIIYTFGSKAVILNRGRDKRMLEPNGEAAIYLGFTTHQVNTCLFLKLRTMMVVESRDFKVLDNDFYSLDELREFLRTVPRLARLLQQP